MGVFWDLPVQTPEIFTVTITKLNCGKIGPNSMQPPHIQTPKFVSGYSLAIDSIHY